MLSTVGKGSTNAYSSCCQMCLFLRYPPLSGPAPNALPRMPSNSRLFRKPIWPKQQSSFPRIEIPPILQLPRPAVHSLDISHPSRCRLFSPCHCRCPPELAFAADQRSSSCQQVPATSPARPTSMPFPMDPMLASQNCPHPRPSPRP